MKKYCLYFLISLFLLFAVSTGCKKSPTSSKPKTPQELTDGWNKFKDGDWAAAVAFFEEALVKSPGLVDAYNGLGWANALLGDAEEAYLNYSEGYSRSTTNYNLDAGLAFVELILGEYNDSIEHANKVITAKPAWEFAYNSPENGLDIDVSDLRLCLAQDYFWLGDFANSLTEVKVLNPSFNTDVDTSAGQEALHQEIMRLRGLY